MIRGISWGMSKSDRIQWEETRKVGKIRFLIVNSVLLNGSLLFAGAILVELLISHERFSIHLIEINAFVWYFGAFIGGLWSWDQNESIRRAFTILSAEPNHTNDELRQKES